MTAESLMTTKISGEVIGYGSQIGKRISMPSRSLNKCSFHDGDNYGVRG